MTTMAVGCTWGAEWLFRSTSEPSWRPQAACKKCLPAPLHHHMQDEDAWRPTEKWCNQLFCNVVPMLLGDEEEEPGGRQHFDLDTFLSDISDTLFTMTQMPSAHQELPEDGR